MRIASRAIRAHHWGMHRDERHEKSARSGDFSKTQTSSRGNVAVAALLLVTAIGVAAVGLDTVRTQNVRSQVAAVGSDAVISAQAEDKNKKGEVDKECKIGYDYVVRYDDKKNLTVKPTLNEKSSKNAAYDVDEVKGNQCPPGVTVIKDGRKCDISWRCKVTVCTPGKMTKNGEEQCETLPSDLFKPGAALDKGVFKDDIANTVLTNAENADAQTRDSILKNTLTQDPVVSRSIYDSLGGEERQTELEKAIQQSQQEFEKLRDQSNDACKGISTLWSPGECAAAADKMTAEQKRLEGLQREAQLLKGSQVTLAPETNPTAAGRGPEVLTCVKDAGGNCTRDERTNPAYKAPPTTFDKADKTGNPPPGGCTGGNCGGGGTQTTGGGASGFNPSQLLPLLAGLLSGAMQQAPSCTITASPKNIAQPGQPVTLSWQSQNAQAAYLSTGGQVGPSGSMTINPQQTTTVTMQVIGYPPQQQQQQQQQQYGQPQGQYVWNPQLGAYVYMQGQQQQQQNPLGQIGQQIGQAISGGGGQQQAQCSTQVTVGADGGGNQKAQISCQPKIADVGMQVAISYACQNSVASKGEGFSTNNQLSGSAQATVASPTPGSTTVKYGLTCSKEGQTDSAECTINVNKPSIVLVANPKNIKIGETSTIGWVTGAMESCVISSPTLTSFTEENKNNTSASGVAKTPPLTQNTKFVLTCTTKAGGTKTAETTVEVGN